MTIRALSLFAAPSDAADELPRVGTVRGGTFRLASQMTLLLLLVASPPHWYVRAPLMGAALGGLLAPSLRESRWFWLAISSILFTSNYHHWHTADNHKHLLAYWGLAIFASLCAEDRDRRLELNARLLIGGAFGLAFIWKLHREFMSGDFFHYTLLFDARFRTLAEAVGGLAPASYDANWLAHRQLGEVAAGSMRPLVSGAWITFIAKGMAGWTLFIEGAVALAFLFPWRGGLARWRSPLLLCFVGTTYLLAPVLGFAYVLLCMGVTTLSASELKRYRAPYIAAFAGVSFYAMSWRGLANALLEGGGL